MVSVVEAAEGELERMAARSPEVAGSALAASVLKLAARLDDPETSATAAAACARALTEQLGVLRELLPPEQKGGALDDIAKRRAARRRPAA